MKKKRRLSYCNAIVICHGKSEVQIVQHIRQSLKINIKGYAELNGKCGYKSIQINGIKKILANTIFKDLKSLEKKYDLDISGKGKDKKINNFKIFIIMDTDDCSDEQKKNFINCSMFHNHWAYEYIVPIYNNNNLEDVIRETHIEYKKEKSERLKELYIDIFPISGCEQTDELNEFLRKLEKVNKTNMDVFVRYCIEHSRCQNKALE